METGIKPKIAAKAKVLKPSIKGKGKARESIVGEKEMRCSNGWPFRYYGRNTDDDHVLDPHDSLFPRGASVRPAL